MPSGIMASSVGQKPRPRPSAKDTGKANASRASDGSARLFASDGTPHATLPIPKISTISALAGDLKSGAVIVGYENYTTPDKWLAYNTANNTLSPTGIAVTSPGDFSNIVAERVFVPSLDGKVKIPLEIVHAKNVKTDGTAPTILTAYGAYGVISSPFFNPTNLAWFERGGVFAQAMIRGGGEYGEAWHLNGALTKKQNDYDDFAACARLMLASGWSAPGRLGIVGGSNGGLLMGAALTQHPELYRAVVSFAGIYDMLRVELTPNGAFNVTEFGTVKDRAQVDALYAYSPYHRVKDGTAYPAVLFTTGANDGRVDPYNSRKMVGRLQAASSSERPILLRMNAEAGHGQGMPLDARVEQDADVYAFLMQQLGMTPR